MSLSNKLFAPVYQKKLLKKVITQMLLKQDSFLMKIIKKYLKDVRKKI